MNLLLNKVIALPKEYSLIADAWCRDCQYGEYCSWCNKYHVEPVDDELFAVYYEALRDEYFAETSKPVQLTADELLRKHGICADCGELYSHHIHEPFASCKCGTSEWYEPTPHMKLEQQLREAQRELKLSVMSTLERKLLNNMLANGVIDNEVIDNQSVNELIDEVIEYALK